MSFFKIEAVEIPFPVIKNSQRLSLDVNLEDYGGEFRNPKYLQNPMVIVDVSQQMSYQFKIELSDPDVSCMICLVGVDLDLDDPRQVNYSYFEKQANPGMYHHGVSELNCLLESGRYLLVCAIQATRPTSCKLNVFVNAYAEKLSDHPCVQERIPETLPKPFYLHAIDTAKVYGELKNRINYTGFWPSLRSKSVNKYVSQVFSEFHGNPGIILQNIKVPTKIMIHIRSIGYQKSFQKSINSDFRYDAKDPPGLNVAVMKINNRNDIRPIFFLDDQFTPAPWGFWSR